MNDLNLLEGLSKTAEADRAGKLGHRLLIAVVLSGLIICLGLPSFFRLMVSQGPGAFFGFGVWIWVVGLGIIFATPFLPSIFFALLDAPWGVRVAGVFVSLGATVACLAFGLVVAGFPENEFNWFATNTLPVVPAAAASMALPFIMFRYLLGWQINVKSWNRPASRQQVSIAGMMIGTFVISICLAGLNLSDTPGMAVAVCGLVTGLTLVFFVPFAFWLLRSKRFWAILAMVSVAGFGVGFVYGFGVQIFQGRVRLTMLFQLGSMVSAGFVWLGLGLIAIRLLCGQLILHRDVMPPSSHTHHVD